MPGLFRVGAHVYLRRLSISRFRSCRDTDVDLQPDLTVLVGGNNSGKTNIIDAVRLVTSPLSGRRDRFGEDSDIRIGAAPRNFEITAEYAGLSDTLKGLLIAAVPDPTKDCAVLGCRYEPASAGASGGRFSTWAGALDGAVPEVGSARLVRHVFLPALRDAHQALGSAGAVRVLALLRHFLPEQERAQFLESVRRGGGARPALDRINAEIGGALRDLTGGVRPQSAEVNFVSEAVEDVARDLRFRLGDVGAELGEIRASGLGYANLLYMATVVVELAKAQEADLTLFLVEEPEAHLHPQLQMLVLDFLLEKAKRSAALPHAAGCAEGAIQVVVSTHSPNLTAWVPAKHLVLIRSRSAPGEARPDSACVPIAKLDLDDETLGKIDRYLDVTRSALLFSVRVALVEGLAESLLLPVLARRIVLVGDPDGLRRFRGTALIPIDGVDFQPYVRILLSSHNGSRAADRVVVITDADPSAPGSRRCELEALAVELGAADALSVFTNQRTLEYDLLVAGNEALLRSVFLSIHPRSEGRWETEVGRRPEAERGDAFVSLLAGTRTRKGDFAQALAAAVDAGSEGFRVPEYLRLAILRMAAE